MTPARPGGETDNHAAPAIPPTAPVTALEAPQGAAGALAAVIDQLRAELAAQREENAQLRKTIENLSAVLARLAGGGASSPNGSGA